MIFRVGTFNLEDLDGDAGSSLLAGRVDALRPLLERMHVDIVCLQEINGQKLEAGAGRSLTALDELIRSTEYQAFHRVETHAVTHPGPADKHNLVILSRWPFSRTGQFWHDLMPILHYQPVTAAPAAREPASLRFDRPALYAAVSMPDGAALHVINLHLKAPLAAAIPGQKESALIWRSTAAWAEGFFISSMKRAGQALETRLFIDGLFDQDRNAGIVICGDLNADTAEVPVRILRGETEDTGNAELIFRTLTVLDSRVPEQHRYSVLHNRRRIMLDHILASPSLTASLSSIEILNDSLSDEVLSHPETREAMESFHAPLVATFNVTTASSARDH